MQKIILIGNYASDRQESMIRFADMLSTGFVQAGFETATWQPLPFLGSLTKVTNSGIGKWLGYIDKWLIFPLILRTRLLNKNNQAARFHICDHANAAYLNALPKDTTSITCHDVLAIRGALGHADAYCPASKTGIYFQRWILGNLKKARLLASVSQRTLDQLRELARGADKDRDWRVIYNAFNNDFGLMDKTIAKELVRKQGVNPERPFLLHVGADHPRKNRKLLLDMVAALGDAWKGFICYAGDAADADLLAHADKLGLSKRLIQVVKPGHKTLQALYNTCTAFIFPSFSEGFGWPAIEAQACGAPLIASTTEPMPEISGGVALYADPVDAAAFASAFTLLSNADTRNKIIQDGFKNCERFENRKIIDNYLSLQGLKRLNG